MWVPLAILVLLFSGFGVMLGALAKSLFEKVILPSRRNAGTKYITAKTDYGEKETLLQWKGKFLDEADLDEIIHVTQDTVILRPDALLEGSGVPIAYVITNVFPDASMRDVLYGIEGSSVMRANCAGPIDPVEMNAKGLITMEIQLLVLLIVLVSVLMSYILFG